MQNNVRYTGKSINIRCTFCLHCILRGNVYSVTLTIPKPIFILLLVLPVCQLKLQSRFLLNLIKDQISCTCRTIPKIIFILLLAISKLQIRFLLKSLRLLSLVDNERQWTISGSTETPSVAHVDTVIGFFSQNIVFGTTR